MKLFYLPLFSVLFFITSCEKDQITSEKLDGEWKLTSRHGGYTAKIPVSTSPDESKLVIHGSDFQVFVQGKLSQSSKFNLVKETRTIDDFKYSYKLDFENTQMLDVYIRITQDKLRMQNTTIAADGTVAFYEKR